MKYLVLFENFNSFDREDYINKIWYCYSQSAFDNPFESREELESLSDGDLMDIYEQMVQDFESEVDDEEDYEGNFDAPTFEKGSFKNKIHPY